jgi:Cytochrome c/Fe2+ transport protein
VWAQSTDIMEDTSMTRRHLATWGVTFAIMCTLIGRLQAQGAEHHVPSLATPSRGQSKAPIHITMEELHRHGGVPPGWKFRFPDGDPQAGRTAFARLECYQCHIIQGESFPKSSSQQTASGPELTGMGGRHPAEYLAESILNPNAVIVLGPGYTDAAGLSLMPDYRGSLAVDEVVDLVAFLQSLGGDDKHPQMADHHGEAGQTNHRPLLDTVAGQYRVRIVYHKVQGSGHHHGGTPASGSQSRGQHHLMAFVIDGTTGTDVPYLPVSVTIRTPPGKPRTVRLMPMVSEEGFHYGADVTLPPKPAKVTMTIEAMPIRAMSPVVGRFTKAEHISFDWTPHPSDQSGTGAHEPPGQGKSGTGHAH